MLHTEGEAIKATPSWLAHSCFFSVVVMKEQKDDLLRTLTVTDLLISASDNYLIITPPFYFLQYSFMLNDFCSLICHVAYLYHPMKVFGTVNKFISCLQK